MSNEELAIIGIDPESREVRAATRPTDIEGIGEFIGQGLALMTVTSPQARELLFEELPAGFTGIIREAISAAQPDHFRDATKKPEPFGYFRPTIDGWEDCAETDEGAVALYDHPEQSLEMVVPDGFRLAPVVATDSMVAAAMKEEFGLDAVDASILWTVMLSSADEANPAHICTNCDTALPRGCGGIFKCNGESCALNSAEVKP